MPTRMLSLKSSAFRRPSLSPRTPQFLTVSPLYSSRSRSPSPLSKVRHSIDVRALPSYLAKKRQSVFGSKIFEALVEVATSPFQEEESNEPLFEEPEAPTLSLGERVAWVKTSGPEFGTVRWIGRMPQVTAHWTVGVEFDNAIGSGDGRFGGRRYFIAKENFAKFLPLSSLTKVDNYVGRPRSGTMLSRMSVQLKPGQLISVQRTPSVNRISLHCALNAPHHVNHDVHKQNMNHCLCNNCNHPCAHLCHTRKAKGKKEDVAHMCHFSHKPHNKMCCGGEDLIYGLNRKPFGLLNGNYNATNQENIRKLKVSTKRKPSRKEANCKPSSAPTSVERKKDEEFSHPLKYRYGSELSISSLPSTSSPIEVYIARGALTDESELESDTEFGLIEENVCEKRGGGLRSLVSCLVPSISSKKKSKVKMVKGEVHKKKRKQFALTASSCSSRSQSRGDQKRRGLSTSPEMDESHCSYCHSSSKRAASASPMAMENAVTRKTETKVVSVSTLTDPIPADEVESPKLSVANALCEGNEENCGNCDNGSTKSSSKSSGHLITTVAEVEVRSPSVQSDASSALSPRRRRKGPAPAPPSPTSTHPSQSSTTSITSPVSATPSPSTSITSKSQKSKQIPPTTISPNPSPSFTPVTSPMRSFPEVHTVSTSKSMELQSAPSPPLLRDDSLQQHTCKNDEHSFDLEECESQFSNVCEDTTKSKEELE
ncbi:CAP-GLY domain containing linker-like protein 5, partial [Leptotrombidium deliense]